MRIPAPVITSAGVVSGTKGDALYYQISATNSPESYSLAGSLPSGVSFTEATGSISGTLDEAGRFDVTVSAANAGGADNRTFLKLTPPRSP